MATAERPWWKDGTVYQIYPASYKDSNGDGLGDIPGIISKLDYIKDLGIDIVWLSPMYKSPQFDMGYDISDYEDVHEPYGTVSDMEDLIEGCHIRGMRLLLDLVVNHTSHEHAWFQESRSSKTNPKRDWYIWRPARYDEQGNRMPPNNWKSYFCGSAWTWDETTQEYYLHLFAEQQPDLNWENPETRKAIYDSAMRFWLDKGVDGFRVDTVNMYSKGEMKDAPIVDSTVFAQPAADLFCNGPRMHEFLREMNTEVLSKYDTMTVGELPSTPDPARVRKYVSASDPQLSMVFQFDVVDLGTSPAYKFDYRPWTRKTFKDIIAKWQGFITGTDCWTTAFCENHDQGRSITRYANDSPQWRVKSAKMLAIMMASLTGTLFVYQGQEIGMINASRDWTIDDFKDLDSVNFYHEAIKRFDGDEEKLSKVMDGLHILARDHARLPMQWDDSYNAGFSKTVDGKNDESVKTWMRVHDEYKTINVAEQIKNPDSVLQFWRKILALRKANADLLIHGAFRLLDISSVVDDGSDINPADIVFPTTPDENEPIFFYEKVYGGSRAIVGLNFSSETRHFPIAILAASAGAGVEGGATKLLVTSYGDEQKHPEQVAKNMACVLRPWEGCIWTLTA